MCADAIVSVMHFLSVKELALAHVINKQFQIIADDPLAWQYTTVVAELYKNYLTISPRVHAIRHCAELIIFANHGVVSESTESWLNEFERCEFHNLTSIQLTGNVLTSNLLRAIRTNARNLKKIILEINSTTIVDEDDFVHLITHENLRELTIRNSANGINIYNYDWADNIFPIFLEDYSGYRKYFLEWILESKLEKLSLEFGNENYYDTESEDLYSGKSNKLNSRGLGELLKICSMHEYLKELTICTRIVNFSQFADLSTEMMENCESLKLLNFINYDERMKHCNFDDYPGAIFKILDKNPEMKIRITHIYKDISTDCPWRDDISSLYTFYEEYDNNTCIRSNISECLDDYYLSYYN
jgi:hypothetical protein